MSARVPHIPDEAFGEAVRRVTDWMRTADPSLRRTDAADNLFRSVGLEGERDTRAYGLVASTLGALRGVPFEEVPASDVVSGVVCLHLGLLVAQATGWDAPLT